MILNKNKYFCIGVRKAIFRRGLGWCYFLSSKILIYWAHKPSKVLVYELFRFLRDQNLKKGSRTDFSDPSFTGSYL